MTKLKPADEYSHAEWHVKLGLQFDAWPRWRVWTHQLKVELAQRFPQQAPELIDDVTMIERQLSGKTTPGWKISPFHQALLKHVTSEYMGGDKGVIQL